MRTVIARFFDYSLDGVLAEEGTAFYDFCRELPDDQAHVDRTRDFYENAALHIMGRKHYQDAAQYFSEAEDNPYADAMNAARKVVFSHTIQAADWADTTVAGGEIGPELERLKLEGDGYIVANGGVGFWRSLIRHDLIDEYRISVFPYVAAGKGTRLFDDLEQPPALELASTTAFDNGITELAYRRVHTSKPLAGLGK